MAEKQANAEHNLGLSEATPHYHGHRERLRARFREAGSEAVSDYELLELVPAPSHSATSSRSPRS